MQPPLRRLPLAIEFGEDLIVVNKPAGFSTHAVDTGRPGLVELVQQELAVRGTPQKLYVVHRLDKTTTGVLIFATTESRAREISELFRNNLAKKRYVMLTRSRPDFSEITVHSKIEKRGKEMINTPCSAPEANATTVFKKVKLNALFQQWEAFPKTGKTHQIRLHAAQVGIPILGDTLYGGAEYPHLCLHAQALELPGIGSWQYFHPIFFERMGLLRDARLAGILAAFDRRQRLYDFLNKPDICLRLSHLDQSDFRIDVLGEMMWVYWYAEKDPSREDLERFEFLQGLTRRKVLIQKMQNRGSDPVTQRQWTFGDFPAEWTARENGVSFEFRQAQGLSPGLFLDQRENRFWLSGRCEGKRVLNLFSYTCGFSVCAALGGAREVVSVDLSKTFLEWGKRNFALHPELASFLSAEPAKALFFAQNAEDFLEITLKKKKLFDVIVLDPPSFSRSNKKIWKFEKDFPELLKLSFQCLASGGLMLCSSNFEKWDLAKMQDRIEKTLGRDLKSLRQPSVGSLDFEVPGELSLMKAFILEKK